MALIDKISFDPIGFTYGSEARHSFGGEPPHFTYDFSVFGFNDMVQSSLEVDDPFGYIYESITWLLENDKEAVTIHLYDSYDHKETLLFQIHKIYSDRYYITVYILSEYIAEEARDGWSKLHFFQCSRGELESFSKQLAEECAEYCPEMFESSDEEDDEDF